VAHEHWRDAFSLPLLVACPATSLLYPDEEIAAKEVKLNGILATEAAGWYEKQLAAAGFTEVVMIVALWLCDVGGSQGSRQ
jgi:hypothetical protein